MNLISKIFILALFTVYSVNSSSFGTKRSIDAVNGIDSVSNTSKRTRNEVAEELKEALEKMRPESFTRILRREGCEVLDPKQTDILKRLVESKNDHLLYDVFMRTCPQSFNLYMEAVKMVSEMNDRKAMYSLIKVIYDPFTSPPNALIDYFVERKDWVSIAMFMKLDFVLEHNRGANRKGLVHFLVENGQYALVKAFKRPLLFKLQDNDGKTPIFYARDRKMIKIIRRRFKGMRDHVNSAGISVWQEAFNARDLRRLNALISLKRRIKKFKRTFLNFYRIGWVSSASLLKIDRQNILKSSLAAVKRISEKWYKPRHEFFIKFSGENGMDSGGVKVDWISSLVNVFFTENPSGNARNFTAPLFKKIDDETGVYAPNCEYNANIFEFAGSIIGLSVALNVPIKVKFIPAIYKAIYKEEIDLHADFMEQSPTIYRNLRFLLTPEANLREMELTFPEKPSLRVSKRNVHVYVEQFSRFTLRDKYKDHIAAFVKGFRSVQGESVAKYLYKHEFVRVLQGKNDYSAVEFVAGCTCESLGLLQVLGHVVSLFTANQRAKLLKFITGSESLPFEGFAGLKNGGIKVEFADGASGPWPTSSTCFNTLRIPPFDDIDALKHILSVAIESTDRIDYEVDVEDNEGIVLGLDDRSADAINRHDQESESDVSEEEFQSENSAFSRFIPRANRLNRLIK